MKLSKTQLAALEAVAQGKVMKAYASRTGGHDRIKGASKKTIEALINRGLVYLNWNPRALGTFTPFDWYALTDAGRDALAAVRKIRSEAQSPVDIGASSE